MPPLLVVASSAIFACRSFLASAVAVRAHRFSYSVRFPRGSGHDELRHGDAVLPCPREFLLIAETAAMSPALLGRPATASAVLARVTFPRAGGCGRTRQRDPGTGQELLHDEQPNEGPSQASCPDRRHTSICPVTVHARCVFFLKNLPISHSTGEARHASTVPIGLKELESRNNRSRPEGIYALLGRFPVTSACRPSRLTVLRVHWRQSPPGMISLPILKRRIEIRSARDQNPPVHEIGREYAGRPSHVTATCIGSRPEQGERYVATAD